MELEGIPQESEKFYLEELGRYFPLSKEKSVFPTIPPAAEDLVCKLAEGVVDDVVELLGNGRDIDSVKRSVASVAKNIGKHLVGPYSSLFKEALSNYSHPSEEVEEVLRYVAKEL